MGNILKETIKRIIPSQWNYFSCKTDMNKCSVGTTLSQLFIHVLNPKAN